MLARNATLAVFLSAALLCAIPARAQPGVPANENDAKGAARDAPEEIIVRGQRLSDFRIAVEAARVRVYGLFNDLNSDDAFDVSCRDEDSTGTRMRQTVCRPRFKDDISSAAAKAWVYGIKDACGGSFSADCIFGEQAASGISRAQAEEGKEPLMQKRFAQEMARVVASSRELQQAILDYEALERAYAEARGGKRGAECTESTERQRCSR